MVQMQRGIYQTFNTPFLALFIFRAVVFADTNPLAIMVRNLLNRRLAIDFAIKRNRPSYAAVVTHYELRVY